MTIKRCLAFTFLFLCIMVARAAEPSHIAMDGASLFVPEEISWKPGPPSLPPGASIAVLEGDPAKEGPFVFRMKVPDGYRIPLHTHPKTERVSVISGTFHLGMGDKVDEKAMKAMPAGTYGHWPAGMKHFVRIEGETIVQFHGEGPWKINYVNPVDDPRKANARRTIEFTEDSMEVVKEYVDSGAAVLVDVRSQEEWNQGHLEKSVFLPVNSLQKHSFDPEKIEKTLPPKEEKILYTFCVVGMRAKQAAKVLEQQGYTVRVLKPGYEELLDAGFEKSADK